ncbi:hypothetical protein OROMI_020155 [Orobanche minor]
MKFSPIYLPKLPEGLSGEQQKIMNINLSSETNDMQQRKSQHDVGRYGNSSSMAMKVEIKNESGDLQQRQCSDGINDVSESYDQESTVSCENGENDSDVLMQKRSSQNPCNPDKQKLTYSTKPENSVQKLQPRRNPETGECGSQPDQVIIPMSVPEKLATTPKEEPLQFLDANHALVSTEEKCTFMNLEKLPTTPKEEPLQFLDATRTEEKCTSMNLVNMSSSNIGVSVTQCDQENFSYSAKFEKVEKLQPRRNPESVAAENTPARVVEKGSDDGYNWRKYGQKLVKGNKFIRSYYKCTYPNCQVKKQVEKSHDGNKTDVNFLGNHCHSKPQTSPQVNSTSQIRISDMSIVSALESDSEPIIGNGGESQHMMPTGTLLLECSVARSAASVEGACSCLNNDNDDKDAKRLKREITCAHDNVVNKPISGLRHVVQTMSEVDLVNDGFRWRKYGQKLVKGNPNPRSYYRCSHAGCPVKKHVERASHDPKLVITTYEGRHYHGLTPSRTISQSTPMSHAANNILTTNGESRPNPE